MVTALITIGTFIGLVFITVISYAVGFRRGAIASYEAGVEAFKKGVDMAIKKSYERGKIDGARELMKMTKAQHQDNNNTGIN
jgi:hypothetical protein